MHGYNPIINKEMDGIFFAYGNRVSVNQIDKVSQLDIAPTILNLLDLETPSYMTGQSIELD
jgi:bisphosphoglycerate-independent phosphoglycerate mutase (AlkP superfamily)